MNCHQAFRRQHPLQRRTQTGVTLVETTVVASVLAIVTGMVVPSFQGAIQRRHLEGAAAQLETDIHYTRTMAVARNATLRISFESGAGGSCYVIHTGAASQSVQLQCRCHGNMPGRGPGRTQRALRRWWPGEPEVEFALGGVRPA
jgi:type IV fimbrial biogenesis protein FimT